jgi:diaminopimelate decarboxylase
MNFASAPQAGSAVVTLAKEKKLVEDALQRATGGDITPFDTLKRVATPSEMLSTTPGGDLLIEGVQAVDLLKEHGSPLYVVSEATLRANFRRVRKAFMDVWPTAVNILYAIKANNNLAIRAILFQEGAGGDCFGDGEFYATFVGGADPDRIVVNGSNKTYEEVERAAKVGARINIDVEDEIGFVERAAAKLGRNVCVNLRLKIVPNELRELGSDYLGIAKGNDMMAALRDEKWGVSVGLAAPTIDRLRKANGVALEGYHSHLGRLSAHPKAYAGHARALADAVVKLREVTGFTPRLLDIGGGWARERDPESRTLVLNSHKIEDYARVSCAALLERFSEAHIVTPELWVEPGRYIVGNAVMLLTRVGSIKRDLGNVWVHVDASSNNLMRVDTSDSAYHVIPASGMMRPYREIATIVGPTCIPSVMAKARAVPELRRDDPLVILDAGMYAETGSTQYSGMPRPATVLVNGKDAEVIKERETVEDVFRLHKIPKRLRTGQPGINSNPLVT